MAKVFEDLFSEIQADMISICLEYVEQIAEKIYVYCSFESGIVSSDFFYCINGQIKERHRINECGTINYDVSIARQKEVLTILKEDIKKIISLCKEYEREMPTQMKLVYDVNTHHFNAEYSYELMYSKDSVKTASIIAEEWFEEVKNASESYA